MIRRLNRGVELFGKYRLFWTKKSWRNKPHPYFFYANWKTSGYTTLQIMRFEFWKRV